MNQKLSVNGEQINPSTEGILAVELFLNENYRFRRNILNGKVEFAIVKAEDLLSDFRPLTTEVFRVGTKGVRLRIHPSRQHPVLSGHPTEGSLKKVGVEVYVRYMLR